mgnify:CR=1 FL=1
MHINYYLDGFAKDEKLFIDNVMQDPRGWVGLGYSFTMLARRKNTDVIILKRSNKQIHDRFPRIDLLGLSVTNLAVTPTEIWINNNNWVHKPKDFIGDMKLYREYIIQHEMGHAIGYKHDKPLQGKKCPVMYQQTRGTLNLCEANPWRTYEN